MRTRSVTTVDIDDIEVELEMTPDVEPVCIQPTPDTLVIGYLMHDEYCENPMTGCDCEGKLYTNPSRYGGGLITDDSSAPSYLGLNEFRSRGYHPEYDLSHDGIDERVVEMVKAKIKADPELAAWAVAQVLAESRDIDTLAYDIVTEMGGHQWNTPAWDWSSDEDAEMTSRACDYETLAKTAWEDLYAEGKIGEYLAVPVNYCSNNHGPGTASAGVTSLDNANAVWVPDECVIGNMNFDGCVTYADKLKVAEKYAEGVLESYSSWANGDCHGYVVESFVLEGDEYKRVGDTDSCWGFIGYEWAEEALKEQMDWAADKFKEGVAV